MWDLPALAMLHYDVGSNEIADIQGNSLRMLEQFVKIWPRYQIVKKITPYGTLIEVR